MAESGDVQRILQGMKDPEGSSIKTVTHLHSEIHSGNAYKVSFLSSATTDGAVLYMQINGADGVEGHLKQFLLSASEGHLIAKLIECSTGSTHTTGSAGITAYNKNRDSTNTASLEVFSDPADVSSTASGNVVIDSFQLGATGGSSLSARGAQTLEQQDEWVIGNSTYILEITCETTAASFWAVGSLIWYEEE